MTVTAAQIAALQAAVTQVQSDIAVLPSVSAATRDQLQDLQADINTALGLAATVQAGYDASMDVWGNGAHYVSGTNPLTMIAELNNLQTAATGMAYSFDLNNKLTRLANNVEALIEGGP